MFAVRETIFNNPLNLEMVNFFLPKCRLAPTLVNTSVKQLSNNGRHGNSILR